MDAFSRKIVGWSLENSLEAKGALNALEMALKSREKAGKTQLIYHSDRCVQYCSWLYVKRLNRENIKISMCVSAEPNENSLAERLNRTLKDDFNLKRGFVSFHAALDAVEQAIKTYNNFRPHASLN